MSETRKPFETFAHYKIGKGFATLSVSVDEGNARVGVSYCHPRDGLDKAFGRTIATKRRESGSSFSFEFKRNKQLLGSQLRDEFEKFIVAAGIQRAKIKALVEDEVIKPPLPSSYVRIGAPPWIVHSLNREIRKREQLARLIESVEDEEVPASSSCRTCC